MKNITLILFLWSIIIALTSCKNENPEKKYAVLNSNDSIIARTENGWYSNMVIIFDSIDKVYLYQTEEVATSWDCDYLNDYKPICPNYIGLRPEYLLTFNSNYFMSFVIDNNDIFKIDSNESSHYCFFTITLASTKDTIKNEAYFEFIDFIKSKRKAFYGFTYVVRHTTEEENMVIQFKKRKLNYDPKKIIWSQRFIDCNSTPFTDKYDSIEKRAGIVHKAIESIRAGSLILRPSW